MKLKLLLFCIAISLINLSIFSISGDVLTDPKDIIIKPKAKNGLLMFVVKYSSYDFKLLVKKFIHDGMKDPKFLHDNGKFLRDNGITESNVVSILSMYEGLGYNYDQTGVIYSELITATVKNIESKQEFKVVLHPMIKRAFIPNITVGRYKFEKLTLTISLGPNFDTYNCDLILNDELPGFTINSNTAFLYGQINLKKGEISHVSDEKSMEKLKKYINLIKKFKRYENLKIVEINSSEEPVK
jgi:hypothetical protein